MPILPQPPLLSFVRSASRRAAAFWRRWSWRAFGLGLLCSSVACYSPNTYSPARTVEPGTTRSGVAVEGHIGGDTGVAPSLLFAVRQGFAERADYGVRIVPDARADVRWNFLRTEVVDATLAPTLWLGWLRWLATATQTLVPGAGAELSLQTDLRLSDDARLTLTVGGGYAIMPPDVAELLDDPPREDPRHGALVHGAVGMELRMSRTLAVHPQISVSVLELGSGSPRVKEVFGIAFWSY